MQMIPKMKFFRIFISMCMFIQEINASYCKSEYDKLREWCFPGVKGCYLRLEGTTNYGKIRRTLPGETESRLYDFHRWAYMVGSDNLHPPKRDSYNNKLEVSHICHNTRCIRADHLSLESSFLNKDRRRCIRDGACKKTHLPYCII